MRVAVAFDHRGVKLRARVLQAVPRLGHELVDLGTDKDTPRIDYPDKALEVGQVLRSGDAERGIFVCGSGVGAAIATSKLDGIRAGLCHDTYSARQGVEHDDMNVLCIGSGVVGEDLTDELIAAFLGAEFNGAERYRRRLEKIEAIEREGLNV
jgi:ribose 5-phosphate isomerase B